MRLLTDLRVHLEHAETIPPAPMFTPQLAVHRKYLIECLNELQQAGTATARIKELHREWAFRLETFVRRVGAVLLGGLGYQEPIGRLEQLINIALARRLGLDRTLDTIAQDIELDRAAWSYDEDTDEAYTSEYALKISALRREGDRRRVTPAGRLVLELPDQDALRWLLTLEATQSLGRNDEWRISRAAAAALVQTPVGEWPARSTQASVVNKHVQRLAAFGLADIYYDPWGKWAILPRGLELLEDLANRMDSPLSVLAGSIVADETSITINRRVGAAAQIASEGAAAAVARHSRMVLHELRNVLVPLRARVVKLGDASGLPSESQLTAITQGFDRAFDFLERVGKASDVSADPAEPFALDAAILEAADALGPEIAVEAQDVVGAPVFGRRDRLVLALVNVLRNAAQSRDTPAVRIWISSLRSNGSVEVHIDDDGPGVPEADREAIFEESFTRREGGTGHGLVLVRTIIERELGGRVSCEASPRGGARFRIRVPVSKKGAS